MSSPDSVNLGHRCPTCQHSFIDISEIPYVELKSFSKCESKDLIHACDWKLAQDKTQAEFTENHGSKNHKSFLFNITQQECKYYNDDESTNYAAIIQPAIQELIKYINDGRSLEDFAYHELKTNRLYFCWDDAEFDHNNGKDNFIFLCYRPYNLEYQTTFLCQIHDIERILEHLLHERKTGKEFVAYLYQNERINENVEYKSDISPHEFKIVHKDKNIYDICLHDSRYLFGTTFALFSLNLTGSLY